MKKIKIFVACHKPSVLPENSLFVPIQVGTALKKDRIPGMVYDNDGDNISDKNATYCELTAQYWAWKNVEADYYGLCHYRRFLCFENGDFKKNEREQIEAFAIDKHNIIKYALNNEDKMRSVIENNDAVVGPLQQVSELYTPRGNKRTALDHWLAHDRALIKKDDLYKMLQILEDVNSEIGKSAREYLQGSEFLGFNCFILKKELFKELCEIEFETLSKLEKAIDLRNYNQQLKRIYGFMGEIICSSYIYHIEAKRKNKVKHLPLVYFNYTDKLKTFLPVNNKNSISVIFDYTLEKDFLFAPEFESFLQCIEQNTTYDIWLLSKNISTVTQEVLIEMTRDKNVNLRFIDSDYIKNLIFDIYGKKISDNIILAVIPFILTSYDKVLCFGPRLLFKKSIKEIWNMKINKEYIVASPHDIIELARINDIYIETEEKYIKDEINEIYNMFDVNVMLLDFKKYREYIGIEKILNLQENKFKEKRRKSEIFNVICENKILHLEQKWATVYETDEYLKYQLPYAPCDNYLELKNAQKDPYIICYEANVPFLGDFSEISCLYWKNARNTKFYEKILAHMAFINSIQTPLDKDILNKLFPKGSKSRNILSYYFPKNSSQYKIIKKILSLLNMK